MDLSKLNDNWELAAKVGGVLALLSGFLRWLLTPVFVHATKKALEPELEKINKAGERLAVGDQRFAALERGMTEVREDIRAIREWVDERPGRRK